MAATVEGMIADILEAEGGFVNDSIDRGGPTNHGVTQATLSAYRGRPVTIADVKALTKGEASAIFRERYFEGVGIDRLPLEPQPIMFDASVNHGPGRAVRFLQQTLNAAGFPCGTVDGRIGPQTVRACSRASEVMGSWLVAALVWERLHFYALIVRNDASQGRFMKGWTRRALGHWPDGIDRSLAV